MSQRGLNKVNALFESLTYHQWRSLMDELEGKEAAWAGIVVIEVEEERRLCPPPQQLGRHPQHSGRLSHRNFLHSHGPARLRKH